MLKKYKIKFLHDFYPMDPALEIKYFFNESRDELDLQIKEKPEDFIVQEITSNNILCDVSPVINLQEYIKSINLMIYLLTDPRTEEDITNFICCSDFNKDYDLNTLKSLYKDLDYKPIIIKDKELRTNLHNYLSYNLFINTKTIDDQFIFERSHSNTYNFVLKKVMMNTVDACKFIERNIGCSVSFAGNKDKKAITYQEVSCKTNINNLLNFVFEYTECTNKDYDILRVIKFLEDIEITGDEQQIFDDIKKDTTVNNEQYKSCIGIYNIKGGHSKRLGDLKGNKFTIKIRNAADLKYKNIENGFINYYGPQRFGKAKNNHIVGEKILNKEYEEAINLIIKNSKGYADFIEKNFEECLRKCDNTERFIFKKLLYQKKVDYKQIVLSMRREIRMLYLHSYQSFLFNKDVNKFIETKQDFSDSVLKLQKMNDKLLKGGERKVLEKAKNVLAWQDGTDFVVSFELNSSCYATMALREL